MEQGLVTENSMGEIITAMCQNIETGTNMRGSAEYRTHLMGVLLERSIRKLMNKSGEESARCQ